MEAMETQGKMVYKEQREKREMKVFLQPLPTHCRPGNSNVLSSQHRLTTNTHNAIPCSGQYCCDMPGQATSPRTGPGQAGTGGPGPAPAWQPIHLGILYLRCGTHVTGMLGFSISHLNCVQAGWREVTRHRVTES